MQQAHRAIRNIAVWFVLISLHFSICLPVDSEVVVKVVKPHHSPHVCVKELVASEELQKELNFSADSTYPGENLGAVARVNYVLALVVQLAVLVEGQILSGGERDYIALQTCLPLAARGFSWENTPLAAVAIVSKDRLPLQTRRYLATWSQTSGVPFGVYSTQTAAMDSILSLVYPNIPKTNEVYTQSGWDLPTTETAPVLESGTWRSVSWVFLDPHETSHVKPSASTPIHCTTKLTKVKDTWLSAWFLDYSSKTWIRIFGGEKCAVIPGMVQTSITQEGKFRLQCTVQGTIRTRGAGQNSNPLVSHEWRVTQAGEFTPYTVDAHVEVTWLSVLGDATSVVGAGLRHHVYL
jgi:hypothetical protein